MSVFSSQSSNGYESIHGKRNTRSCYKTLNFPEITHKTKEGNKSKEKCWKNKMQCTSISQIMRCSDPNNCQKQKYEEKPKRIIQTATDTYETKKKTHTLKRLLNLNLLNLLKVFLLFVSVAVCLSNFK